MADLGTAEPTEVLPLSPNSSHPTDNSSPGLTTPSGENYQAHRMERRSSLAARSSGLALASSAQEEAMASPAVNNTHDKCDNIDEASAEKQKYLNVSVLTDTIIMARRGEHRLE